MKCKNCGAHVSELDKYCPECGSSIVKEYVDDNGEILSKPYEKEDVKYDDLKKREKRDRFEEIFEEDDDFYDYKEDKKPRKKDKVPAWQIRLVKFISFINPLIGIIIYFAMLKENKKLARSCLKCALAAVIIWISLTVLFAFLMILLSFAGVIESGAF